LASINPSYFFAHKSVQIRDQDQIMKITIFLLCEKHHK